MKMSQAVFKEGITFLVLTYARVANIAALLWLSVAFVTAGEVGTR